MNSIQHEHWLGQTVEGGWQIVRLLDEGGFGRVYLAKSPGALADQMVVIKVPFFESIRTPEDRARWDREIEVLVTFNALPGVPTIFYAGVHQGAPFYVCQYIDAGTLENRLRSSPHVEYDDLSLPREEVFRVLRELAITLDAIHVRQHVHRDVKPKNVLFSSFNHVFLADFGLARRIEPDHRVTAQGMYIGTAHYSSQNHLYGYEPQSYDDLHSLAVIGYRLLSGKLPFPQSALPLICKAIDAGPLPLHELSPDIPAPVSKVFAHALRPRSGPSEQPRDQSSPAICLAFVEEVIAAFAPVRQASLPDRTKIWQANVPVPFGANQQPQTSSSFPESRVSTLPHSPLPVPDTGKNPPGAQIATARHHAIQPSIPITDAKANTPATPLPPIKPAILATPLPLPPKNDNSLRPELSGNRPLSDAENAARFPLGTLPPLKLPSGPGATVAKNKAFVACPGCRARFELFRDKLGKVMTCSKCQTKFLASEIC